MMSGAINAQEVMMRKNVVILLATVLAAALGSDATHAERRIPNAEVRASGRAVPVPVSYAPDDSMLAKLDSIPPRSAYQCIYVRNDTVFRALQAQVVHLRFPPPFWILMSVF